MKKKITILLISIIFGMAMPSCTNLDENVYDKLSAESFGSTEVEVNALLGTVYNTLKTYWPNRIDMSESAGSMAVRPTRRGGDWYDGGQYREFYMHTWTAQTSAIRSAWNSASTAVGTCNATIDLLKNSEFMTDETIASVRGVRAFWLYIMLDYWGNVPLVIDYQDRELPANKSRQEVFDWLIQEVSEIAKQCPDGNYGNYGKFTKGAAYFLLAKLYLNAEAWKVNVNNAYAQCIAACDSVLDMDYTLEPDYKTNFGILDRSREGILTVCFSESNTEDRNELMNFTLHYADNDSEGSKYGAWNGICAQPDYVKLFDTEDPRYAASFRIGQRFHLVTGDTLLTGHGNPLNYTVNFTIIPDTEYDGGPWGAVVQEAGARCQKWPYSTSLTNAMGNHFHIFRLADIYLTKAEALLRSGGDASEATRLVNEIRKRAYGDETHNHETVDLAKVQLERRFELAWESWSRQDDIRFDDFENAYWSESNCPRKTDKYLRLFPIPQTAWQTNQNLVQNPDYPSFGN
ncbi:MAG: RagB/SusD family nutrient uptake outer membrane protein [Tannerella sp.]|nr:RagB/SusD family nutrient uptake outer membrane protein [Tannerella sp.]